MIVVLGVVMLLAGIALVLLGLVLVGEALDRLDQAGRLDVERRQADHRLFEITSKAFHSMADEASRLRDR